MIVRRPWAVVVGVGGGRRRGVSAWPRCSARSSCRSSTRASSGSAPISPPASRWKSAGVASKIRQYSALLRRSAAGQLADRAQRFGHRSVRAESQRAVRGAQAVRHLGIGQAPRPSWSRAVAKRLQAADSGRVLQLHAADHRQRHRGRDRIAGRSGGHHQRPRPERAAAAWRTQTLDVVRQVPGAADTGIEQEEDQAQLRIAVESRRAWRATGSTCATCRT